MLGEKLRHLGLDRLGQQGARSVAQHLGERVANDPGFGRMTADLGNREGRLLE